MIVVDASSVGAFLFHGQGRPPDTDLHAPEVCDLELVSAVLRLVRERRMTLDDAATTVAEYLSLPLMKHAHAPLLGRILELRDNFSAYDASYVALAEQLGAPLLTADSRLARAVRRHLPHIALA